MDFEITEPSVITLGKFDGLHLGHRYLMEAVVKGKAEGLKSVVFTFDIPPKAVNGAAYKVLSTKEEKLSIFEDAGIDYLIECPFTEQLRQMMPYDFLKMLTDRICIKKIAAGTDFRFGYKRSGSYLDLERYADTFSYETVITEKKQYKGRDISSTRIRTCIENGEIEEANRLLGYHYFVRAKVEHGNALGRTLGFPTANLLPPPEKLLPPNGGYCSQILIDGKLYNGISNIGRKPTIKGEYPVGVETNIFDFDGDIYGKTIQVSFLKYLRPEQKFDSVDDLVVQMEADRNTCKEFFEKEYLQRN